MKRSKFSLSNYKLLSCDMGELVPIGLTEVLAGDSIQMSTSALVRAAPLLAPVMHPVHVNIHHWFVPHRLVWEDWEDFITGGPDGLNASVFPTITVNNLATGTLGDYLGVPTGVASDRAVSALPYRGYALIYNEWYRDQDLTTPLTIDLTSGPDTTTNTALQTAAWEKDYFTSARPWEQKGPAITIPIGTTAPILGLGVVSGNTAGVGATGVATTAAGDISAASPSFGSGDQWIMLSSGAGNAPTVRPQVFADLSSASAVTVNVLREALALQRYEEARARYGSRYTEYLRYLGVTSSDARLQRPEYLGGGKNTIQFSEVLQTAEGSDPVGEMRGHGISATRSNRFRRFFEEHGYIFSFCTVRPKAMYGNGLFRHWNRRTKEDFWQKELQHIGQQEVLNKEVYMAHTSPDGVFGYQDRYDEYRRQESTVSGEFRSPVLNFWHMARIFSSNPALNNAFVQCIPTERTFASSANDVLYIMARHRIQARRLVAQTGQSFIY